MGKVCARCGEEALVRDGETLCGRCAGLSKRPCMAAGAAKAQRLAREEAMRACGLVKVRGAMGGTYWE